MGCKNIYWFLIDGLSPLYLHSCGNKKCQHNFIDSCIENGTCLSYVYSAGASTHTSMHTFFTGFYPTAHGAENGTSTALLRRFKPEIFTITDVFKQYGYTTYRYGDAIAQRAVPKSGFDFWEHGGFHTGQISAGEAYLKCERRNNFIQLINKDNGPKFVYHHFDFFHDINNALGRIWPTSGYVKNIKIAAKYFETIYKSYNISNDDIVIISSDHGVYLGTDYTIDEIINGPQHREFSARCFMAFQGEYFQKKLLDGLVRAIDIAPTICDIILNCAFPCQGTSIKNYILDDKYEERICFREKCVYYVENPSEFSDTFAIRDGYMKYAYSSYDNSEWLMNLQEDGDYQKNLKNVYPDVCKKFRHILNKIIDQNKNIDIKKLYRETTQWNKKDIKECITIIVYGEIDQELLDFLLDLSGPYYKLLLTREQIRKCTYNLEHPLIRIKDGNVGIDSNYVVTLSNKYSYDETILSDMYRIMREENCDSIPSRIDSKVCIMKTAHYLKSIAME